MLNEERIKLMTKMAAYEEKEGRKNMSIGNYFRSDYVELHVLKSIACATISYVILFGLFIYYDFEIFMQDIYKKDLVKFGKDMLLYYCVFVGVYAVISYIIYSYRYSKAKKSLKRYHHNLRQLAVLYDQENKR